MSGVSRPAVLPTPNGCEPEGRADLRRRWARRILALVAIVTVLVVLWNAGGRLITGESVGWQSYLLIVALVFGDAICPVLPGETTLNAGSVLASSGLLQLWLVVLAGAIGAVLGDSTLYWMARKAK